ncbi:MAG: FixG Ig-like domain-containing protein, partial [bacterium]|nr:FixG Ig-like domain-containing protein [bacterium]
MLFQFGWFREQFCTVLFPYARFQSVLMDSSSIVVGYDAKRGEPRGKASDSSNGDCVDCKLCVKVCPTGIDIRNGVQLECIACTCCVDACDSVMTKLGRKTGLIRYDSEERLLGKTTKLRLFRPRVLLYAILVLGFSSTMIYLGETRSLSDVNIVRMAANSVPYTVQDPVNGIISNQLRAVLSNKNDFVDSYTFTIGNKCEGCQLIVPMTPFPVEPHQTQNVPIFVQFPHTVLHNGEHPLTIDVKANVSTFEKTSTVVLLGPE